ncbi:hypothetical protein MP228_002054 [Amoeboaphelidium protococcarum]|nr:hypothetical protein MP228_002054 [Amoeboaphelidium protococcarum]
MQDEKQFLEKSMLLDGDSGFNGSLIADMIWLRFRRRSITYQKLRQFDVHQLTESTELPIEVFQKLKAVLQSHGIVSCTSQPVEQSLSVESLNGLMCNLWIEILSIKYVAPIITWA